jgi:D-alanyl-D-alanine carboxypeptidase
LDELLPEKICGGIPHIDRIDVRDLLVHASGIYNPHKAPRFFARFGHQFGPEGEHRGFLSATELARALADPNNPPEFAPGTGQSYNGFNYVLLELIVEAVSGRSLPDVVQAQILDPLDLKSTYYLATDRDRPRARGYTVDSASVRNMGLHPSLKADAGGFVDTTGFQDESNGGSGIIASMPDQVRFARAVVEGTLLNESSTSLLLAVIDQAETRRSGMHLGILRATKMPIGLVVLALGNCFGTHVVWAYHPDSSAIVAIGVNQFGGGNEAGYIMGTMIPNALQAVQQQ